MSSIPGYRLEDYLMWKYNLKVVDQPDVNFSLRIAEILGTSKTPRPTLEIQQFAALVVMFEPYRKYVEERLSNFDEVVQSWRDYAGYSFYDLPAEVLDKGSAYLKDII